jgi:alpha-L-fucosidase 2
MFINQESIMNKISSISAVMVVLCLAISCKQDNPTVAKLCDELKINNPKHGFVSALMPTKWEESLISGNGTLGTLMPGNPNIDRLVLSHEKLFLPKYAPAKAPDLGSRLEETRQLIFNGKYEEAGEIMMEEGNKVGIKDLIWTNPQIPACQIELKSLNPIEQTAYARSTNYETGETKVAFTNGKSIIHRNAFVSRTDDVAVLNITSPSKSKLSYKFRLNQLPDEVDDFEFIPGVSNNPDDYSVKGNNAVRGNKEDHESFISEDEEDEEKEDEFNTANFVEPFQVTIEGNFITYTVECKKKWNGSLKSYAVVTKVIPTNGVLTVEDGWIKVEEADEILVLSAIELSHELNLIDNKNLVAKLNSLQTDYATLLSAHSKIHSEMFNRFSFNLGKSSQLHVTAEELLASSTPENFNQDLVVQLLKSSRYNNISSTGEFPPSLQGIWGGTWWPAWSGDFTLNGNVPSSIAHGLNCNFPEVTMGFLNMMTAWFDDYKDNAKELYGLDGIFVPSRASDFGSCYHYVGEFPHLYWWTGTTWPCHFFYDYWLYTGDEEFLKTRAIPFMLESYKFLSKILYKHDGQYIFIPSYSPEIGPIGKHPIAINATMDVASMKQFLRNLITLAEQEYISGELITEYKEILDNLPKYEIDKNGELKEWIWDDMETDNAHRHASHLYMLYDGLDPEFVENPTLVDASIKAIESRMEYRREGEGAEMAFGLVQLGTSAAHLKDVAHAYESVKWLCSSYWNQALNSYHDPGKIFNLDISGGLPAVVTYMLIQSTSEYIELLPALPSDWPNGSIKGALARGGFLIDLEWENGVPKKIKVKSLNGNSTKVVFKDREWDIDIEEGETIVLQ